MALIKKQEKANFKKLRIEMNEDLMILLNAYSEMIEASVDYVIGEALKMVFIKDKEFLSYIKKKELNFTQKEIENLIVTKPEKRG